MRRAERGFTLFEVLAAVAILGILYTVLAGVAMQGLRSEGSSKRRLEASLKADNRLAAIELDVLAGVVPEVGVEESAEDDYLISVAVEPFELELPELQTEGDDTPFLGAFTTDNQTPLRVIQLTVTWVEGGLDYEVVRTTFAFDVASLDPSALPQLPGSTGQPGQDPQGLTNPGLGGGGLPGSFPQLPGSR